MSELRKYIFAENGNASRLYRANNRRVEPTAREKFNSYGESWEKTAYYPETEGYLVTEIGRIVEGNKNKQNRSVFDKEQEILKYFAERGFRVEHLSEPKGRKAPDARMSKKGMALVDGELVEIKSTKSVGHVVDYGTEAIHEKGAQKMIYCFTERNKKLIDKIHELARKNIHGYYYFSGDEDYKVF